MLVQLSNFQFVAKPKVYFFIHMSESSTTKLQGSFDKYRALTTVLIHKFDCIPRHTGILESEILKTLTGQWPPNI